MTQIDIANNQFKRINQELSTKHKGKIVAIELHTGDYFIGNSELEAYNLAIKKYPGKEFLFKRIGFDFTHFVGSL